MMNSHSDEKRRRKKRTLPTYNCPYFGYVKGDKITAVNYKGEKCYTMHCDCMAIRLPYQAFVEYRNTYCASKDVNAWQKCSAAAIKTKYEEGKKE